MSVTYSQMVQKKKCLCEGKGRGEESAHASACKHIKY